MSKRVNPTNKNTPPVVRATRNEENVVAVPSFWKNHGYVALIFAVLGFALYFYSLKCEYVLDDQIVYTDNKFVKKGFSGIRNILSKETFVGYFGEQKDLVTGARYRPLSLVTFAIEHQFFNEPKYTDDTRTKMKKDKHGEDLYLAPPAIGHFNNILLYILSTLLLFRVLSMLFPAKEETPWYFSFPFVASLLFLLHPIHTEAVANIKGRDEILAFIGAFGTLYYVLKWKNTNSTLDLLKAAGVFFLGLLAKENALTFLAVIPLCLYYFTDASKQQIKNSIIMLLVVFLLWLMIRTGVIGYILGSGKEITDVMNNPFYGMTTGEHFATVFYTLGLYIKLLFVPIQLTHDYYPYQIPIMNWGCWETILSTAVYVAMGLFGLWGLKTKNFYAFCASFYLATLSIVSNLPFSVGTFMNERFVYLSSVAFCMMLAYWATIVLPKWIPAKVAGMNLVGLFLAGALAVGYSAKTLERVPAWESALSLNSTSIKVSPNSARANLFMGTALFNKAKVITNKEDSSRKEMMYRGQGYVKRAVKIVPTYYSAIHMLSGLDSEVYAYDRNLDTLLTKFQTYMKVRDKLNVERQTDKAVYMDLYLEYLNQPANAPKLIPFYKNVITMFLEEKKDMLNANRYLKYALPLAPQDTWLNEQMAKVQAVTSKQPGQLQQPQQQLPMMQKTTQMPTKK